MGALIGSGIALAVVGALTLHRSTSPVAQERPSYRLVSSDPIARDLYLRGRAAWSRRTPASLAEATQLFGEAAARDPRMADAYVGLADSWLLRREFAAVPEAESFTRADAATDAALAIDRQLPGGIRARGFIDFWWRRDKAKGLDELRRAVELAPEDAQSHHWLATALGAAGDNNGAIREIEAARALDPANPAILTDRASTLIQSGRLADAVAALREIVAAYPAQSDARASLATTLLMIGDAPGYARGRQSQAALRGEAATAALYGEAAEAFARGAAPIARQTVARHAEAALRAGWLPPSEAARLVSLAGDHAGAKEILETQAARREPMTLVVPAVPL